MSAATEVGEPEPATTEPSTGTCNEPKSNTVLTLLPERTVWWCDEEALSGSTDGKPSIRIVDYLTHSDPEQDRKKKP